MTPLTKKILDSLVWVFSNMVATNGITFVRTVVLWSILGAAEFGLNATTWLVVQSLSFLQDMGFTQALVQRRQDVEKAACVTFWVNLLIHSIISASFFVSAPWVAAHFEVPELVWLIRVASLSVVVRSLCGANFALLKRSFRFKAILVVNTSELVLSTAAQITLALLGYGVWSLVWGHVLGVVWRTMSLWIAQPIRIGWPDLTVARDMFHFGKHVTLSALFLWIVKHLDDYLVAKHLGMVALGFYTLAYRLSHMVSSKVTRLLGAVLFPAFCEIGSDFRRARLAWLKASRYAMALIVPLGLGLMLFAPELVVGLYPPECDVVTAPLIILTSFALCRGVGITLGDLARGVGRPDLVTRAAVWHLLLMAPALYLAVHLDTVAMGAFVWLCDPGRLERLLVEALVSYVAMQVSLVAVSLAVSATAVSAIGYTFYQCVRLGLLESRDVVRASHPAIVAGTAMIVLTLGAKAFLYERGLDWWGVILVAAPIAVVAYTLCLWASCPALVRELRAMVRARKARKDEVAKPEVVNV